MTSTNTGRLTPGRAVPPLNFLTPAGVPDSIHAQRTEALSMIAVYRGGWCLDCRRFLTELNGQVAALRQLGVTPLALSVDSPADSLKTIDDWKLDALPLGCAVDIEQARGWGLYASRFEMHGALRTCIEPGLFLLKPDHTLYALWLQSLPSARPDVGWLVETIGYLASKNFPLRGAD